MIKEKNQEQEPNPEVDDDVYLGVSIILPQWNLFPLGKVINWKREVDGNPNGRENTNPIFNTREYEVEFGYGEVTELTANNISRSIHDLCDIYSSKYFFPIYLWIIGRINMAFHWSIIRY